MKATDKPLGRMIEISKIRLRPDLQVRAEINQAIVREYAQLINGDVELDPIVVFEETDKEYMEDTPYFAADGFHRMASYKRAKRDKIPAIVREGSYSDALLAALVNFHHGARTTNADKRRAVELVLAEKELRRKSNTWIARECGVSPTFVQTIREGKPVKVKAHRRSKSSSTESNGGGGGQKPATVRERDDTPTASEMIEERIKSLKDWLKEGALDWPAVLEVLNGTEKRHRFLAIPKKECPVVVLDSSSKFIKEIVPSDLYVKSGKLEIVLYPDGEGF